MKMVSGQVTSARLARSLALMSCVPCCFTYLERLPVQLQPLIAHATVDVQLHQLVQCCLVGGLCFIDLIVQKLYCAGEILIAEQSSESGHDQP